MVKNVSQGSYGDWKVAVPCKAWFFRTSQGSKLSSRPGVGLRPRTPIPNFIYAYFLLYYVFDVLWEIDCF